MSLLDQASRRLDAAEQLAPGHGRVDLFAGLDRTGLNAGLLAQARLNPNLAAFAEASANYNGQQLDGRALVGLRGTW